MSDSILVAELEQRISELSTALQIMTEDRDAKKDAADSLWNELQAVRARLTIAETTVDRLRLHIQQGVEL